MLFWYWINFENSTCNWVDNGKSHKCKRDHPLFCRWMLYLKSKIGLFSYYAKISCKICIALVKIFFLKTLSHYCNNSMNVIYSKLTQPSEGVHASLPLISYSQMGVNTQFPSYSIVSSLRWTLAHDEVQNMFLYSLGGYKCLSLSSYIA